ncbi:BTB/POZ domain-containing protein 6-B-like [Mya arenaria]|uniref:BTB/POZ domain-containing protein 6-B-like n=1 Tax=Mya arenaria TaxID=6604 RepID=UPI0022E4AB35|nr:BTB/POZ domain-containing protein 6-B-like [Mya arenaria]
MSAQSAISEDGGFVKPDVSTWQESKSLVECNRYMMTYEVDCDITFLVGSAEEEVKGHIFVMTSRSGKMASLLAGQRIYPDIKLKIPDIEPDSFRDYLLYLYTDEVELENVGRARELIRAAHRYGPKSLQDRCFSFLLTEINADNVCVTLELADYFNEDNIFERCFRFINVNAVDVLKASNFPDLCEECVHRVLTSDALNADEFEVYDAVIRWADGKCARTTQRPTDETRRQVLGSLLFSVRFAIMDVDEFTHKLSTKDVLSTEEKVVLYQFYHGEVNVLPDMFNRTPRRQYRQRDHVDNTSPLTIDGNRAPRIEQMNIVSLPRDEEQRFQRSSLRRVTRFWGIGGPWNLIKGADAIRFQCSKVIILRGIEIFGPYRGTEQYNVSVTLTDDLKTDVRKESFTIDAKVPGKKTYDAILRDPVRVPPNRLFTISVLMKGAPCLQGLNGTSTIETEGVTFQFMNSNQDVSASQWQESKTLVECNRYMMTNGVDFDVTCLVGKTDEEVMAHLS